MTTSGYTPHRSVLILVLGLLSLTGGLGILAPVAWVLGRNDLREMDEGRMDPEGRGMTQAGTIIGMIMTILMILSIFVAIAVFVLFIGTAAVSSGV